jgi:membrane associated rhomboid family serine protease
MNESPAAPYEGILKLCAQAAPAPWYPGDFAQEKGWDRAHLDEPLDQLRLAGLIELTDWVSGKGQGYRLTPDGEAVIRSPRLMSYVREGRIPVLQRAAGPSGQPAYDGTPWSRGEAIRTSLAYPLRPRVTQALVGLNVLVFALGFVVASQNGRAGVYLSLFGSDMQTTHTIGSLSAADLVKGEWWRLLACCFVHYGIMHIAMNMYALWVVGRLAEQIWGHWRYLTIYLAAGLCGSCAAVLTSGGAPSAGASGAIWGVLACLPAWLMLNRRHLPQRLVSEWMRQLISVLVINAVISFLPGISWAAHFGGGAAGFVVAVLLNAQRFSRGVLRWVYLLLVPVLVIACIGVVVRAKDTGRLGRKANAGAEPRADRQEQREIDRFNTLLPEVNAVKNEAVQVFQQSEQLRKQDAGDRKEEDVQATLKQLRAIRAKLASELKSVDQSGPFESDFVDETWRLTKSYLKHTIALSEKYEECLVAGKDWTREKDQELVREINRTNNAFKSLDARITHPVN